MGGGGWACRGGRDGVLGGAGDPGGEYGSVKGPGGFRDPTGLQGSLLWGNKVLEESAWGYGRVLGGCTGSGEGSGRGRGRGGEGRRTWRGLWEGVGFGGFRYHGVFVGGMQEVWEGAMSWEGGALTMGRCI